MLWVLPLERYEERYTGQWYRWFKEELETENIDYQYIEGQTLTTKVETGVVLDAAGTNYWKFSQMMEVCHLFKDGKVHEGDKFFTMDLWHPALEAIPYMAQLFGINVEVYGFLHAGSYTTEDFAEPMAAWAQYFEKGWAKICKGIFVGSDYHKQKFLTKRWGLPYLEDEYQGIADKIHVTGNPFNTQEFYNLTGPLKSSRGKTIVFPNRFDIEKRPNDFMVMMDRLWEKRQDFHVIFTTSREEFRSNQPWLIERLHQCKFSYEVRKNLSKRQYYQILASSRIFVSTTIEEFFGYCLLEALAAGCIPVVADAYSHPELLNRDNRFLVNVYEEDMTDVIDYYLDNDTDVPIERVKYYDSSIERMIEVIYGS